MKKVLRWRGASPRRKWFTCGCIAILAIVCIAIVATTQTKGDKKKNPTTTVITTSTVKFTSTTINNPVSPTTTQPVISSTKAPTGAGQCLCTKDYNCKDFKTQKEAQTCFNFCGGSSSNNWSGLDGNDQDGKVCESLP